MANSRHTQDSYVLEHDPAGDYNRGSVFPTRHIQPTLAANGFSLGTVFTRGNRRYIVAEVRRGRWELRQIRTSIEIGSEAHE